MMRRPTAFRGPLTLFDGMSRHLLVLLLLVGLSVPGCSGCGDSSEEAKNPKTAEEIAKEQEEREKKKREAQRPPIDLGPLHTLPGDRTIARNLAKPGHWSVATQAIRANHNDVQAEFETLAVDVSGNPRELERAPFQLMSSRPAALPKTQPKFLEAMFFLPREAQHTAQTRLQRRLTPISGTRAEIIDQQLIDNMADHEYFLVVLTASPDRYLFLRHLHSIKPPAGIEVQREPLYYHVTIPDTESGIRLPSQPLAWTSIAYLIWDNIHPASLAPDQQQALLDWLHWGGQIIINGPGSLEKLSGSFLEPLLPAESLGSVELQEADLEALNANWSLQSQKKQELLALKLSDGKPLFSLKLAPKGSGRAVEGTGGLICETKAGRGRIVVTAFSVVDPRVLNWGSLDSFLNGCLLRRPARGFEATEFQETADMYWQDHRSLTFDARIISQLRYFSRDTLDNRPDLRTSPATNGAASAEPATNGRNADDSPENAAANNAEDVAVSSGAATGNDGASASPENSSVMTSSSRLPPDPWSLYGWGSWPQSGVGGWNDQSAVAVAARETLKEAAGISIPESGFVLRVLAIYLLVLVPVNWLFFRLLGRVEWAWVAAPVLAIVASVTVIRVAQLDIGFARSRTEVATVELQGGYDRGHLTRYTALYTSLSSSYSLAFEEPSSLALPFSTNPDYVRRLHDPLTLVTLRRDRQMRLTGFTVISNSTGMLHSEQMLSLGGSLRLEAGDSPKLVNDTDLVLRQALVLHRTSNGELQSAFVNVMQPKTAVMLQLQAESGDENLSRHWRGAPVMSGQQLPPGEISLQLLVDVAARQIPLRNGESRLVGWTDHAFAGLEIQPESNQTLIRTLVVAHLTPPDWLPAQPDANLYVDVVRDDAPAVLTDELLEKLKAEAESSAPPNP